MRVAFDIDGVFADMNSGLARVAAEIFPAPDGTSQPTQGPCAEDQPMSAPTAVTPHGDRTLAGLGPRRQARVWDRVRRVEHFWESLAEIEPGAVARLAVLAERQQWHVLFLTQRPETAGRTAQVQSQLWLQRYGFQLPSVCITRGSRGPIARALDIDVMVDDRRDNCLDIRGGSDTRVILVDRGGDAEALTKATRLGIECVPGVMAALDLLEGTGG